MGDRRDLGVGLGVQDGAGGGELGHDVIVVGVGSAEYEACLKNQGHHVVDVEVGEAGRGEIITREIEVIAVDDVGGDKGGPTGEVQGRGAIVEFPEVHGIEAGHGHRPGVDDSVVAAGEGAGVVFSAVAVLDRA